MINISSNGDYFSCPKHTFFLILNTIFLIQISINYLFHILIYLNIIFHCFEGERNQ
jgi:hypothetical protein